MAQHGYLREYDEDFGSEDRGRERDERDWRSRERGRGFMFDDDRDRRGRDDDRGFFSRMGDEARSWFRDDERDYRRGSDRGAWENNRDWPQRERGFSSHPDDHYRSWRDRQMRALDDDYADYCREREQQFHRDFDSWRETRQQSRSQQKAQQVEDELLLANTQGSGLNEATGVTNDPLPSATPEGTATSGTGISPPGRNRR